MLWFHLFTEIKQQRNNLFLWSPMAFAFGIAATFAHGHWIGPALFIFLLICVLGYLGYYGVKDSAILPLLMLLFVATLGAGAASLRSYAVWAPALSYPYYGEAQGVIRTIDRSASGSLRVTLRVSAMDPISERHRPQYVGISLPKYAGDNPEIGHSIKTTAYVTPPQGPVEPDGFDFRRHAYFQSLGGVGYARKGFERVDAPREQRFWKDRQRRLSNFIAEHMPERSLGFAQVIISGDRLNLSLLVIEDLRRTNLAHLLAISGLHMGLLTTVVFGLLRIICVVIPIGHIRWHARSIAAFGAILAGVAYLGLSGNSIATQRAFVMIARFFGGVILSRRALTLRSLALAALIILALRPEALYSPGFQMSFAATIALVSVFDFITRWGWGKSGLVLNYITGAVVSSVVAGLATARIAAIHFNQISQIGYIANLLAVPVMALVVAPAAVIALALSPLHLAPVGFWFVDLGLTWIQFIAGYLAEFDLAVRMIKTPMDGVLPLFSFGVLWCVLWSGKYEKSIGIFTVCLALGMWATTQRPEILIADHGRLIGVLNDQGRALSKEKGQGFVSNVWMENDGIKLDRRVAFDLWQRLDPNITHIWSKKEAAKTHACDPDDLIVSHHDIEVIGQCLVLQKRDFYDFGATYVVWTGAGYAIKKRVDKHHAPYAWQPTSKRRQSIGAYQSD